MLITRQSKFDDFLRLPLWHETYAWERKQRTDRTGWNTSLTTILQEIVKSVEQEKNSTLCSILLLDIKKKHLLAGAAAYTRQRIIVEEACQQTWSRLIKVLSVIF